MYCRRLLWASKHEGSAPAGGQSAGAGEGLPCATAACPRSVSRASQGSRIAGGGQARALGASLPTLSWAVHTKSLSALGFGRPSGWITRGSGGAPSPPAPRAGPGPRRPHLLVGAGRRGGGRQELSRQPKEPQRGWRAQLSARSRDEWRSRRTGSDEAAVPRVERSALDDRRAAGRRYDCVLV